MLTDDEVTQVIRELIPDLDPIEGVFVAVDKWGHTSWNLGKLTDGTPAHRLTAETTCEVGRTPAVWWCDAYPVEFSDEGRMVANFVPEGGPEATAKQLRSALRMTLNPAGVLVDDVYESRDVVYEPGRRIRVISTEPGWAAGRATVLTETIANPRRPARVGATSRIAVVTIHRRWTRINEVKA